MSFNNKPDGSVKGQEYVMLQQIAHYLKQEQLLRPEEFVRLLKIIDEESGRKPCGQ